MVQNLIQEVEFKRGLEIVLPPGKQKLRPEVDNYFPPNFSATYLFLLAFSLLCSPLPTQAKKKKNIKIQTVAIPIIIE